MESSLILSNQGSYLEQQPLKDYFKSMKGEPRGRRGRKPAKLDTRMKLEKSQQSARECRARKKLRYQYLEELVASREKAIFVLREELEMYKDISEKLDEGQISLEEAKSMCQNLPIFSGENNEYKIN